MYDKTMLLRCVQHDQEMGTPLYAATRRHGVAAALVALGAVWPDHDDGHTTLQRGGYHVSCAAVASGWLAVPNRN
jgi:hypothetical protein